jgi:hypothetical protein
MEVGLPRSRSRTLEVVDVVIVLLDTHQLLPNFAGWYLPVPTFARGLLEASMERVEAQVDGMLHDDELKIQGHHHTRPFLREFTPSATR